MLCVTRVTVFAISHTSTDEGNIGLKYRSFKKKRDCTVDVEKTKSHTRRPVTAQLVSGFVFAYVQKQLFSDDVALMIFNSSQWKKFAFFEVLKG